MAMNALVSSLAYASPYGPTQMIPHNTQHSSDQTSTTMAPKVKGLKRAIFKKAAMKIQVVAKKCLCISSHDETSTRFPTPPTPSTSPILDFPTDFPPALNTFPEIMNLQTIAKQDSGLRLEVQPREVVPGVIFLEGIRSTRSLRRIGIPQTFLIETSSGDIKESTEECSREEGYTSGEDISEDCLPSAYHDREHDDWQSVDSSDYEHDGDGRETPSPPAIVTPPSSPPDVCMETKRGAKNDQEYESLTAPNAIATPSSPHVCMDLMRYISPLCAADFLKDLTTRLTRCDEDYDWNHEVEPGEASEELVEILDHESHSFEAADLDTHNASSSNTMMNLPEQEIQSSFHTPINWDDEYEEVVDADNTGPTREWPSLSHEECVAGDDETDMYENERSECESQDALSFSSNMPDGMYAHVGQFEEYGQVSEAVPQQTVQGMLKPPPSRLSIHEPLSDAPQQTLYRPTAHAEIPNGTRPLQVQHYGMPHRFRPITVLDSKRLRPQEGECGWPFDIRNTELGAKVQLDTGKSISCTIHLMPCPAYQQNGCENPSSNESDIVFSNRLRRQEREGHNLYSVEYEWLQRNFVRSPLPPAMAEEENDKVGTGVTSQPENYMATEPKQVTIEDDEGKDHIPAQTLTGELVYDAALSPRAALLEEQDSSAVHNQPEGYLRSIAPIDRSPSPALGQALTGDFAEDDEDDDFWGEDSPQQGRSEEHCSQSTALAVYTEAPHIPGLGQLIPTNTNAY